MRAFRVLDAPGLDDLLRLLQRREPLLAKRLGLESAAADLGKGIIGGPARTRERIFAYRCQAVKLPCAEG
jgi:hypothetical protein